MFTTFQKAKLKHHFNVTDFNQDGVLTREDMYKHGEAYGQLLKLPPEPFIGKELAWWNKMNEVLNIKEERALTFEEHLTSFEIVMNTSDFIPTFLWDYVKLIWKSLNLKTTQTMDYKVFSRSMLAEDSVESKYVFDLLDTDKKSGLYIHEIYHYWLCYFYSNDKTCPSKWVFGKIEF
jgi:hypothetical protein